MRELSHDPFRFIEVQEIDAVILRWNIHIDLRVPWRTAREDVVQKVPEFGIREEKERANVGL